MNAAVWRVAAASVRGSGHEKAGLPCQDAHHWSLSPGGLLIAAVSDGAGSALLADVGAAIAVRAAVDCLATNLALAPPKPQDPARLESILRETIVAVRTALEKEAAQRSVPLRDLACTLIAAFASADFVAAIQVGDGALVAADPEGKLVSITRPAQGEHLNDTIFLTSEEMPAPEPVVCRGPLAHLALLTDGLQMAALRMPAAEPHPGFFTPLFQFVAAQTDPTQTQAGLEAFLSSPKLRDRTDDDVTLLLASVTQA